MHRILSFLIGIMALGLSPDLQGAEVPYNGHFWQTCPPEIKHFYVQGVMSGVLLGQDRVVRFGLPNEGAASLSADCHRDIVRMVNALERQIEQWNRQRLVTALDAFYREPDNRPLDVRWAVMAVMLEQQGAPHTGAGQQ